MATVGRKKGQRKSVKQTIRDSYNRHVDYMYKRIAKGLATTADIMPYDVYTQVFSSEGMYNKSYNERYQFEKTMAKSSSRFETAADRDRFNKTLHKYMKSHGTSLTTHREYSSGRAEPGQVTYDLSGLHEMHYSQGQMMHMEIAMRISNGEDRQDVLDEYGYPETI